MLIERAVLVPVGTGFAQQQSCCGMSCRAAAPGQTCSSAPCWAVAAGQQLATCPGCQPRADTLGSAGTVDHVTGLTSWPAFEYEVIQAGSGICCCSAGLCCWEMGGCCSLWPRRLVSFVVCISRAATAPAGRL